jgi:OPA family glycerol-3-phosphate transporter-like MFS transporter/OPA family sugar phosphate sensor protein UhpC-like MFS transporter
MLSSPQTENPPSTKRGGFFAIFKPEPPAPPIQGSPEEIKKQFRYWQNRILISSLIGYALFYFVRKNIGMAMPYLEKDLGLSKSDLGLFLTLHGVLYGISKFANGFLADRANARTMMVAGLVLSAIANFVFGFSTAVVVLGVVWMLNGWFQGIGFPPCARLMTHWFSPKELATKMSIWNTSHSIGAGLVVILCGYLLKYFGNWRLCFIVPGAIALVGSIFLFATLRDTPSSLGLPEVEGTESKTERVESTETTAEFKAFLRKKVFGNPYIWIIALANFFVYTVRYSVLDWGPTLLHEFKHFDIAKAGWMTAAFEGSGVAGMLVTGWLTDKLFKGRGARMCVFCMALTAASIFVFWKIPARSFLLNTAVLCCAGFFIYGPQALVGISVANLATKRAAATAVGVTGIFGYASGILSGWGLGRLVEVKGWNAGFAGMLIAAAIGTLLFVVAWPAKAHGYDE